MNLRSRVECGVCGFMDNVAEFTNCGLCTRNLAGIGIAHFVREVIPKVRDAGPQLSEAAFRNYSNSCSLRTMKNLLGLDSFSTLHQQFIEHSPSAFFTEYVKQECLSDEALTLVGNIRGVLFIAWFRSGDNSGFIRAAYGDLTSTNICHYEYQLVRSNQLNRQYTNDMYKSLPNPFTGLDRNFHYEPWKNFTEGKHLPYPYIRVPFRQSWISNKPFVAGWAERRFLELKDVPSNIGTGSIVRPLVRRSVRPPRKKIEGNTLGYTTSQVSRSTPNDWYKHSDKSCDDKFKNDLDRALLISEKEAKAKAKASDAKFSIQTVRNSLIELVEEHKAGLPVKRTETTLFDSEDDLKRAIKESAEMYEALQRSSASCAPAAIVAGVTPGVNFVPTEEDYKLFVTVLIAIIMFSMVIFMK